MRVRACAGLFSIAVSAAALGVAGITPAHADTVQCFGVAANVHSEAVIDAAVGETIAVTGDGMHRIVWHGGSIRVCGTGNDTIDYSNATGPVDVGLHSYGLSGWTHHKLMHVRVPATATTKAHTITVGTRDRDFFSGVENVVGSPFKDHISGNRDANVLMGGAGDDIILGHGGSDTLIGNDGKDRCVQIGVRPGCLDGV